MTRPDNDGAPEKMIKTYNLTWPATIPAPWRPIMPAASRHGSSRVPRSVSSSRVMITIPRGAAMGGKLAIVVRNDP